MANAFGKSDELIQLHPIYFSLGTTMSLCQQSYRGLFFDLPDVTEIDAIREALNQELVLGREKFKDEIETMIKRQTRPGKAGRPCIGKP